MGRCAGGSGEKGEKGFVIQHSLKTQGKIFEIVGKTPAAAMKTAKYLTPTVSTVARITYPAPPTADVIIVTNARCCVLSAIHVVVKDKRKERK